MHGGFLYKKAPPACGFSLPWAMVRLAFPTRPRGPWHPPRILMRRYFLNDEPWTGSEKPCCKNCNEFLRLSQKPQAPKKATTACPPSYETAHPGERGAGIQTHAGIVGQTSARSHSNSRSDDVYRGTHLRLLTQFLRV